LILLIEPISKNLGMYVPAYPLPILEIGGFVNAMIPESEIRIISLPVDYGLPLTQEGKNGVYREFLKDLGQLKPKGVGISCTAIAQAEEVIHLAELIKKQDPDIFVFIGGYFPTIYYEEIFSKTSAIDVIVIGEGEYPALNLIEHLETGKNPFNEGIPGLAWKKDGQIHLTKKGIRFDLEKKAPLDLRLLKHPGAYDILPYAFSRGCPYHCNFCMEEFLRPTRKEVPDDIITKDLIHFSDQSNADTLLISDALFRSFHLFPFLRSLGMKINFETRADVLRPSIIPEVADVCGIFAIGFESASYNTLRRMNKIKDEAHYQKYLSNTKAIFKEAIQNEIPVMVFMIAGYPGDTEEDLKRSLAFAEELSKTSGPGGHVFKVGECHVYPKTKIHQLALSLPDVVFDGDGVFGQNIVRKPSKGLDFETVSAYVKQIFDLSHYTPRLQERMTMMMPYFRLPVNALRDEMIPPVCFRDKERMIFNAHGDSLSAFRKLVPKLTVKYKKWLSGQRSTRSLPL